MNEVKDLKEKLLKDFRINIDGEWLPGHEHNDASHTIIPSLKMRPGVTSVNIPSPSERDVILLKDVVNVKRFEGVEDLINYCIANELTLEDFIKQIPDDPKHSNRS